MLQARKILYTATLAALLGSSMMAAPSFAMPVAGDILTVDDTTSLGVGTCTKWSYTSTKDDFNGSPRKCSGTFHCEEVADGSGSIPPDKTRTVSPTCRNGVCKVGNFTVTSCDDWAKQLIDGGNVSAITAVSLTVQ